MSENNEQSQNVEQSSQRGLSKIRQGIVVSDKMDKSIVVSVVRQVKDPKYGKFVRRTKKYMAHDGENQCEIGDTVRIVESRPLSKNKRWRVQSIVTKVVKA